MKIAITGITGFIGKSLAAKLLEQGHSVTGLVHSPEKARLLPANVRAVYGTVFSRDALLQTFDACDVLYHCAAVVNGRRKDMMEVNVDGTRSVCETALGMGIQKMIHLSSIAVISGNDGPYPLREDLPYAAYNDYGVSKIEAEKVVRDYIGRGLNAAIVRPSAVYGPGEPHVLTGILKLSNWGVLPLAGSGSVQWQLIHIDDLTGFLASLINNDRAYKDIFNVSSGETIEMRELYRLVREFTGRGVIISIPVWLILPMAWLADLPLRLYGQRPFTNKVKFFQRHHIYDTAKAQKILGLDPRITLKQGLAQIFEHASV